MTHLRVLDWITLPSAKGLDNISPNANHPGNTSRNAKGLGSISPSAKGLDNTSLNANHPGNTLPSAKDLGSISPSVKVQGFTSRNVKGRVGTPRSL